MLGKEDLLKLNLLHRQELKGIRGEINSKLLLLRNRLEENTITEDELKEQLASIYKDLSIVRLAEIFLDNQLLEIAKS